MRFTAPSVPSVSSVSAKKSGSRDCLFCGGLLLAIGGWVAANPLPQHPDLPSVCQSRLSKLTGVTLEAASATLPPVWVDTRRGVYYLPGCQEYGHTPGGKYLLQKAAQKQGYRSETKLRRGR